MPVALAQKGWSKSPCSVLKRYTLGKVLEMFTPTPPTDALCALPIIRCHSRGHLIVVFVCPAYTGVLTHWIDGETMLHRADGPCEGCDSNQAPRWQGFIIVAHEDGGRHRLLQFTPPVARVLDRQPVNAHGLSGTVVKLQRDGKERNSPLNCQIVEVKNQYAVFDTTQLELAVARLFRAKGPVFESLRGDIGRLPTE